MMIAIGVRATAPATACGSIHLPPRSSVSRRASAP
jgi:hypothetical protein